MIQRKKYLIGCAVIFSTLGIISCDSIQKMTNSLTKKNTAPIATTSKEIASLNGKWRLNYITGPRITFDGLFPNKKPYLILDSAAQKASGNTGCNNFTASFKTVGDSIQFNQIATTMMSCMDGGQGETLFLRTMEKVSHYRINKDTLWLQFRKIDGMRFLRDTSTVR